MTELDQEIAHLQELQAKHRRNIRALEEMLADYGLERPLPLLNNLEFEQEQLRQVEERLATALAAQAGTEEAPAAPAAQAAAPRAAGQVTVTGPGPTAVGDRATAAGVVAVGGDVHRDVHVQTGDVTGSTVVTAGGDVHIDHSPDAEEG